MEGIEDIHTNDSTSTNQMDIDDANELTSNDNNNKDLWHYMTKQQNEKAKCEMCDVVLSRKNGSTTGLRKHLHQVHKLERFGIVSKKSRLKCKQLSNEEKKSLDALVIQCVLEDGRSFSDMRQSGILKVFNRLVDGKKNTMYLIIFYSIFCLGYVPPHRNTIQRHLKQLEYEYKLLLTKELVDVHSLGITCDLWSDKRLHSYLCLTGHYILPNHIYYLITNLFAKFFHLVILIVVILLLIFQ